MSKKLHLSKSKLAVFSNSGQLSIFYFISSFWGSDIIFKEHYISDVSKLWSDYPAPMPFLLKLYIITQLAYNLHEIPELYFQRVKKEEYAGKIIHAVVSMAFVYILYSLNFNRLLVCLLVLHHASEFIHHASLVIKTIDKEEKFTKGIKLVSIGLQILARLGTIILAVITLWYGFALGEQKELDYHNGYFNSLTIRTCLLGGILLLQVYLTFTLISEEISQSNESKAYLAMSKMKGNKKEKSKKGKSDKKTDESDLPEVDQNTNKSLRSKQKLK